MNILKSCLIFLAGGGIGAAVAWKITANHYEKLIDKEIESVKDTYRIHLNDDAKAYAEHDISTLREVANEYRGDEDFEDDVDDAPVESNDIYMISDEDFVVNNQHYEKITINHYVNDIFTDDQDNVMDGYEAVGTVLDDISRDFDGVVYVRNNLIATDYEVIFLQEEYNN